MGIKCASFKKSLNVSFLTEKYIYPPTPLKYIYHLIINYILAEKWTSIIRIIWTFMCHFQIHNLPVHKFPWTQHGWKISQTASWPVSGTQNCLSKCVEFSHYQAKTCEDFTFFVHKMPRIQPFLHKKCVNSAFFL